MNMPSHEHWEFSDEAVRGLVGQRPLLRIGTESVRVEIVRAQLVRHGDVEVTFEVPDNTKLGSVLRSHLG